MVMTDWKAKFEEWFGIDIEPEFPEHHMHYIYCSGNTHKKITVIEYNGGYLFIFEQGEGPHRLSLTTTDEQWVSNYGCNFENFDMLGLIKLEMEW